MEIIGAFLIGVTLMGFVLLEYEDRQRARRMEADTEAYLVAALRHRRFGAPSPRKLPDGVTGVRPEGNGEGAS